MVQPFTGTPSFAFHTSETDATPSVTAPSCCCLWGVYWLVLHFFSLPLLNNHFGSNVFKTILEHFSLTIYLYLFKDVRKPNLYKGVKKKSTKIYLDQQNDVFMNLFLYLSPPQAVSVVNSFHSTPMLFQKYTYQNVCSYQHWMSLFLPHHEPEWWQIESDFSTFVTRWCFIDMCGVHEWTNELIS